MSFWFKRLLIAAAKVYYFPRFSLKSTIISQITKRVLAFQVEKTEADRSLESLINPDVFNSEAQLRQNQRETIWSSKGKRPARCGTMKRPSHKVLHVARRATKAEIKSAYVQLMRTGADVGELNEAYKILWGGSEKREIRLSTSSLSKVLSIVYDI